MSVLTTEANLSRATYQGIRFDVLSLKGEPFHTLHLRTVHIADIVLYLAFPKEFYPHLRASEISDTCNASILWQRKLVFGEASQIVIPYSHPQRIVHAQGKVRTAHIDRVQRLTGRKVHLLDEVDAHAPHDSIASCIAELPTAIQQCRTGMHGRLTRPVTFT